MSDVGAPQKLPTNHEALKSFDVEETRAALRARYEGVGDDCRFFLTGWVDAKTRGSNYGAGRNREVIGHGHLEYHGGGVACCRVLEATGTSCTGERDGGNSMSGVARGGTPELNTGLGNSRDAGIAPESARVRRDIGEVDAVIRAAGCAATRGVQPDHEFGRRAGGNRRGGRGNGS